MMVMVHGSILDLISSKVGLISRLTYLYVVLGMISASVVLGMISASTSSSTEGTYIRAV
jgi:hypothetical protein